MRTFETRMDLAFLGQTHLYENSHLDSKNEDRAKENSRDKVFAKTIDKSTNKSAAGVFWRNIFDRIYPWFVFRKICNAHCTSREAYSWTRIFLQNWIVRRITRGKVCERKLPKECERKEERNSKLSLRHRTTSHNITHHHHTPKHQKLPAGMGFEYVAFIWHSLRLWIDTFPAYC